MIKTLRTFIADFKIKTVIVVACVGLSSVSVSAETLQDALISAYNSNPKLLAERARVREIDENYVQADAQGRLTSSLNGSLGYTVLRGPGRDALGQPTGGTATTDAVPRSAQVQVIQPLYQGGRVRALKSQAKAGILAAREGLRSAEQSLFLSVASAYSNVRRDEEAARVRRNNVRVLSRQLQAATDRFDVGEGTRTDVAQARARLAAADIGLAQADAQLQISRSTYHRAVGHVPMDLKPLPKFVIPESVGEAITLARANNPQIIAAMLNERAAVAAIDVAKAASKPTVSIVGSASTIRDDVTGISRAETGSIAAQISIPIFSGGVNRSRVRAAGHARLRSVFEMRDAERAVDEAVKQVWAQLDAAKRSLVSSETQVEAAEFAFEGVKLEQELGTRNTLDVLNAEQEVLNAKLAMINTQAAVDVATVQLLTTMGGFDAESIQLDVNLYDPNVNFEQIQTHSWDQKISAFIPDAIEKSKKTD